MSWYHRSPEASAGAAPTVTLLFATSRVRPARQHPPGEPVGVTTPLGLAVEEIEAVNPRSPRPDDRGFLAGYRSKFSQYQPFSISRLAQLYQLRVFSYSGPGGPIGRLPLTGSARTICDCGLRRRPVLRSCCATAAVGLHRDRDAHLRTGQGREPRPVDGCGQSSCPDCLAAGRATAGWQAADPYHALPRRRAASRR